MLATIIENKGINKDSGETSLQHSISEILILILITFASTNSLGRSWVSGDSGTLHMQLLN